MPHTVILKLLRAIVNLDSGLFAYEFVANAFIDVLEATPAADVVYKN
jgi:hypothetical protein